MKKYIPKRVKKTIIYLFPFLLPKYYTIASSSVLYQCSTIINALEDKSKILIGENTHIRGELYVLAHGGKIEIGDYCFVGRNTYIWSGKSIKIGNRVLISHNCNIFDNDTHPLDPDERHKQFKQIITTGQPRNIDLKDKAIVIEDDVLIAANSTILKGVKIGRGAIIGAGSVVTKDIMPFSIVAGNPAKVINTVELKGNGENNVN